MFLVTHFLGSYSQSPVLGTYLVLVRTISALEKTSTMSLAYGRVYFIRRAFLKIVDLSLFRIFFLPPPPPPFAYYTVAH